MSGAGRKSKYRKRVTTEYLLSTSISDNNKIGRADTAGDGEGKLVLAQILENRGCNLFNVQLHLAKSELESLSSMEGVKNEQCDPGFLDEIKKSSTFIAKLPKKFNKCIWIKKDDFVLVSGYDEDLEISQENIKIRYEIVQVLNKENIKNMKAEGIWPIEKGSLESSEANGYSADYEAMNRDFSDLCDEESEMEPNCVDDV